MATLFPRVFKLPGRVAELGQTGATIGWNLGGALFDWAFNINRLRIEAFAKRRFPEEYARLDGGDIRLMRAFLEPECASNTVSLLLAPGLLATGSEALPGVNNALAYADDAFGPLARRDNSFVLASEDAYRGSERWFFINGVATSRALARMNADALKRAFKRDFIAIHNPTQGLVHDLVESAMQKLTNINTEPVARAFLEIATALLDASVNKVVVIAHSQGTIVTGDVLDLLYCAIDTKYFDRTNMNGEDLEDFLDQSHGTVKSDEIHQAMQQLKGQEKLVAEKLELYMFANAASRMCYLDPVRFLPHIESFANERDIVTRLGSLARDEFHEEDLIRIDGPVFTCRRYGHLFNAHYLPGLLQGAYTRLEPNPARCIGSSIHDDVLGNPCAKNPRHVAGPRDSRLEQYLNRARLHSPARPRTRPSPNGRPKPRPRP